MGQFLAPLDSSESFTQVLGGADESFAERASSAEANSVKINSIGIMNAAVVLKSTNWIRPETCLDIPCPNLRLAP